MINTVFIIPTEYSQTAVRQLYADCHVSLRTLKTLYFLCFCVLLTDLAHRQNDEWADCVKWRQAGISFIIKYKGRGLWLSILLKN